MSEISGAEICQKCRQPALQTCDGCELHYCPRCDQNHWVQCISYEICQEKRGYFLKARRVIQKGEIIFCELPLVLAPKTSPPEGELPCVGCCRFTSEESCPRCPECSWPVCTPECPYLGTHKEECKILKLKKDFFEYKLDVLLLLRMLLLEVTNKKEWEKFLQLLEEDREETDIQEYSYAIDIFEKEILEPVKKYEEENNTTIFGHKSENFFYRVLKFLKTNSIEDKNLQIYYPTTSWIDHSCCPNASFKIEPKNFYKITIRATSLIPKDTQLTISHVDLLQGTYARRQLLKTKKKFSCLCTRCKDPTEFGTYFSALVCLGTETEACKGTQLPVDPTDENTLWVCGKCQIELPNDQMMKFLEHLDKEVSKVLEKPPMCKEVEDFLEKLLMFLHPNHFSVYAVKSLLVELWKEDEDFSLEKKIDVLESLVGVNRKLFPEGYDLHFGRCLHELFDAKFESLKKVYCGEGKEKFAEEIRGVSSLVEEIKKVGVVLGDGDFDGVVAQDVSKFEALLQM